MPRRRSSGEPWLWASAVFIAALLAASWLAFQAERKVETILRQAKPVGVRTAREYDYLQAVALFYKDVEASDQHTPALAFIHVLHYLALVN